MSKDWMKGQTYTKAPKIEINFFVFGASKLKSSSTTNSESFAF